MNSNILYNNFIFNRFDYKGYRYTDSKRGSPLNYLACMLKGECKIVSNETTIEVKEGGVFFIPKGLPYESFWYGKEDISFLSLGFDRLDTSEMGKLKLQNIDCPKEVYESIVNLSIGDATCKTLSEFYGIMSELLPIMEQNSIKKDELILKKAIRYINMHPDCSVPDIARAVNISEPYVYIIFKKHMNTTPNDYRQKAVCEKGRQLLLSTNKSVDEISEMLRISSGSYFRKLLKKHLGMTPREIRKSSMF